MNSDVVGFACLLSCLLEILYHCHRIYHLCMRFYRPNIFSQWISKLIIIVTIAILTLNFKVYKQNKHNHNKCRHSCHHVLEHHFLPMIYCSTLLDSLLVSLFFLFCFKSSIWFYWLKTTQFFVCLNWLKQFLWYYIVYDWFRNGVNGVIYYSYHFNVQKIDLNFMKVIKLMQVIDPNHFNYRRDQWLSIECRTKTKHLLDVYSLDIYINGKVLSNRLCAFL